MFRPDFSRLNHELPAWQRYTGAIVLTIVVATARLALNPWWGETHNRHLVFFPIVMISAYLAGFGPGVVATVLSSIALDIFWAGPTRELHHLSADLLLFGFSSVIVCALIESLHFARARAERLRSSRDRVMAIVAHDLRNSLGAIKLTAGGLRRRAAVDPDSIPRRLEIIDHSVVQMETLIRDLVDVTRLEFGEMALEVHDQRVSEMVSEVQETFTPIARAQGVKLEVCAPQQQLILACDRDRLLQALNNLVVNAIKFTPKDGTIFLCGEATAGGVRFLVRDTGPGIKPEHLAHLFEAYWKADTRGTGLGLYIAQGIVTAHGGNIVVESREGHGATFSFEIPHPRTTAASAKAKSLVEAH